MKNKKVSSTYFFKTKDLFQVLLSHGLHDRTDLCLRRLSAHLRIHRTDHLFIDRWILFQLLFKTFSGEEIRSDCTDKSTDHEIYN